MELIQRHNDCNMQVAVARLVGRNRKEITTLAGAMGLVDLCKDLTAVKLDCSRL